MTLHGVSEAINELHRMPFRDLLDMLRYIDDEYERNRQNHNSPSVRADVFNILENRKTRIQSEIERRFKSVDLVDEFCREYRIKTV